MRCYLLLVALTMLSAGLGTAQVESGEQETTSNSSAGQARVPTSFGKLPLYFVENRGVYPDAVRYYIQGADKTLFFTDGGVTYSLKGKSRNWTVKLDFVGANRQTGPEGLDKQQAVFSYFKGPEKDWKAGLPSFSKIVYRDLWPGIDLVYNGTVNKLKYEFVIAPGADASLVRLWYRGASSVTVTETGALKVTTPEGSFEDARPEAWQEIDGKRVPVEMTYVLGDDGRFRFSVGDYDRAKPLVLDPAVLVYCGYVGGGLDDWGRRIAVDAAGCAYLTGATDAKEATFPVSVGPDLSYNGGTDVFVAKVSAQGIGLLYCGYIGGSASTVLNSGFDYGYGIAVDAAGNAYVTGMTTSDETTFPVKGGPDLTHNGRGDVFLAKVNAKGTGLVYCGYIGGSADESGFRVAVDAAGNAYVAGQSDSTEATFPVRGGPDLTHNGGTDAFVAKVDPNGTGVVYCGFIGGSNFESAYGIAVDANGSAYVMGDTVSTEKTFPVTVGPDLTFNSSPIWWNDVFVAKVDPKGTKLVYCGYIGGSLADGSGAIAVDAAGSAYVAGGTNSTEATFPVKGGPDLKFRGGVDGFVAKVNPQGTGLDYCGYIGGSLGDGCLDIAVDVGGNAFVTGVTLSDEKSFPVKFGPDLTQNGREDAFVAKVDPTGTGLVYCGYIGGSGDDQGHGIAVGNTGDAYVVGYTYSAGNSLPVRVGPDLSYNGGRDAFAAKVSHTLLSGSGASQPGGIVSLDLTATDSAGRYYQLGSSLGTGPIQVGIQNIGLSPDHLLAASVSGLLPGVFSGYRGVIDAQGRATAALNIPAVLALIGTRVYSAFVTLDPAAPLGIRSISNTFLFTISK